MDDEITQKLLRELRLRLTHLQLGIQYCTPLVMEHGTPSHQEYLAMLNQNMFALLRTVSHLELSNKDACAFRPVTLDLAGLCRKLGREVDGVAQMTGITFLCEVDEASLLVEADEDLLERALLNLIANAVAAARQGGGHVWLRLKRAENTAHLIVQDDGPGFLPETEDHASFTPAGGLGLGLKLAESVAALHKGALLRLNQSQGAQVRLSLPIHLPGTPMLRSPHMGYEPSGGFSPLLVELSTVLPHAAFLPEYLD